MDDETLKSPKKISSFMFKIVTSFFATFLTAIIGFFVYDYFGGEDVGIANIEVQQLSFYIEIPKKLSEEMESLGGERYDRNSSNNNKNKKKILNQDSLIQFLSIQTKRKKRFESSLAKYNSDYAKSSNINIFINESVKNTSPTESISLPLKTTELEIISEKYDVFFNSDEFESNKKVLLQAINKRIESLNKDLDEINNVLKKVVKEAYDQVKENRTKYQIEIVLFNSGGMQAVVRYKGQLDIEGTKINLIRKKDFSNLPDDIKLLVSALNDSKTQESFLSEFVLIESKSFNGMTLIVDEFNNRKRDIQFSEREYISGQKMAKLSVYNINDKKYQEQEFNFRNALYEEEKEQLGEYLRKEYGRYFNNNFE